MTKRQPSIISLFVALSSSSVWLGCGANPGVDHRNTDAKQKLQGATVSNKPASSVDSITALAPVTLATNALQPHMVMAQQDVYVTFIQNGNIVFCSSNDAGKTFSKPSIAIDVSGNARGGAHRGPRIGVDRQGKITITAPVTFDESEYKKKYPTSDLFATQSNDGGKTWSRPFQINEMSKKAPESLHWMTVADNGQVHINWLDLRNRNGPGQDLFYANIKNGSVGDNRQIATTVCECCAPGLAVDGKGNPVVAYREGGPKKSREIFFRWSADGGESFVESSRVNRHETLEAG